MIEVAATPDAKLQEVADDADKTVKEMTDYVQHIITSRFPQGVNEIMFEILADLIVDSFHDGARWAESQRQEESRIILT